MSIEILYLLLPQLASVAVESLAVVDGVVVVTARTRDGPVPCTGCGQNSAWLHSNYQRHVADEAVGGRPLCIDLTVRRLYRENPSCSKKTFAEQVDGLTAALCETAEAEEADGTAVELGQEALAIHRKTGHRLGQARTLMALAPVHRKTDGAAAELMERQAWHIFSDIGMAETEYEKLDR